MDCEACHGPGDGHAFRKHSDDGAGAVEQGFLPLKGAQATGRLCGKCRNAASPTAKSLPPGAWSRPAHRK